MPKIILDPTQAILDEARKILFTEGYEGLNMRVVAKKCGIATGTIYNYFPKKDDLLSRLMMDYWNKYFEIMDQIDNETDEFFTKLKQIYKYFKEFTDDFHAVFLSQNFKPDFSTDETRANKENYMKQLQLKIEWIVTKAFAQTACKIPRHEISEFILANFIAISFMPSYSYEQFERILKVIYDPNL